MNGGEPQDSDRRAKKGLLIVNTGDGKGKSTAAVGVMARAWARGWNTVVFQFIKSGDWKTGEERLAEHLGIEWHALGDGFTWDSEDIEQSAKINRYAWDKACQALRSGTYDLIILDELTYLLSFGWLNETDVTSELAARPSRTSVVVTGRDAPAGLIELADTVTEMRHVKHAFDAGIIARRGLDY